jgi:ribosomal protein S18 acetylase RimI-like enzyme
MVEIRLAIATDVSIVEEVVRAAYEPFAARIGFRPAPLDADYRSLVDGGHVRVTAPRIDGVLVLSSDPDALGVDNIAVHPEAQSRGVGAQLMSYAFEHAIANGFTTVRLYTHSLMTDNIAWYERLGFVETSREPLPIGERVHMAKDLGV